VTTPRTPVKSRGDDGGMRFGLFWPYQKVLIPSPALSALNPDPLDVDVHVELARATEDAGLDFALIADQYTPVTSDQGRATGFQDPTTQAMLWAVPIIRATRTLGVITTMHPTFLHPLHVARFGAHLDWLSGGRWGWNVTTGFKEEEFTLFGYEQMLDHDVRYELAEDAVTAVRAIWASRGEPIDVDLKHFRIQGRLSNPFPVQESPVLVNAGSSDTGLDFAARLCDYSLVNLPNWDDLVPLTERMTATGLAAGRERPAQILVGGNLVIRDEPGRAQEELDGWLASADEAASASYEKAVADGMEGYNTDGSTARKPPPKVSTAPQFVGTTEEVTEKLLDARRTKGLGGVLFALPAWGTDELRRLVPVLENLERAGEWRHPRDRGHSW